MELQAVSASVVPVVVQATVVQQATGAPVALSVVTTENAGSKEGVYWYIDREGRPHFKDPWQPEEVQHVSGIDPERWAAYERAKKEWHALNYCSDCTLGNGRLSGMTCVAPWCGHFIFFAPCIWCFPMCARASPCCCNYQEAPLPDWHEQALKLTASGVRCGEQGGITWDGFDMSSVVLRKSEPPASSCFCGGPKSTAQWIDQNGSLECGLGFGCCVPCCYRHCCSKTVPGHYSIIVRSKSTHKEGGGGESGSRTVSDVVMEASGLTADPDLVMDALRAGCENAPTAECTQSFRNIIVSGAEDARVNGTFKQVPSLPSGGGDAGPLIWRKEGDNDWLHIMWQGQWWICHFADATEDLFYTEAVIDNTAELVPPVGMQWSLCAGDDFPGGKGTGRPPTTTWA